MNFNLEDLRLKTNRNVTELVSEVWLDVSDRANVKGDPPRNVGNPKYCCNWCFEREGICVLGIWFKVINVENDGSFQVFKLQKDTRSKSGSRKPRAEKFHRAVKPAYENCSHPFEFVLGRNEMGNRSGRAWGNNLWSVVKYDDRSGVLELRGCKRTSIDIKACDADCEKFEEGGMQWWFVLHRKLEATLLKMNVKVQKAKLNDRLACEVPGCGFWYEARYGEPGNDHAQAHHLLPLSTAPDAGIATTPAGSVGVCANCRGMVHRGGKRRNANAVFIGGQSYV